MIQCEYCDECFPTVYRASTHMDKVHPAMKEKFDEQYRTYNCIIEDCQKTYYTVRALHHHYRLKHGQEVKDLSIYAKPRNEKFKCPFCDKKFRNKDNFDDHQEEHKAGMGTLGTKLFQS